MRLYCIGFGFGTVEFKKVFSLNLEEPVLPLSNIPNFVFINLEYKTAALMPVVANRQLISNEQVFIVFSSLACRFLHSEECLSSFSGSYFVVFELSFHGLLRLVPSWQMHMLKWDIGPICTGALC
ncbi:hypothetical protein AVEN_1960-1 [Araneus ventricosus]|uniref:Uncharacterized protein n=1 Tax=Araneus ventricosus TaxID=182803 RepID=A0A4Y2PI69_ARAVE|nr:hypothetical protein AVEN_1960-1 [Araneus ventricosus]